MLRHILAVLALLVSGQVLAASDCKLIRIEEWPVRMERNLPVIDGEINGNKVGILIDTGSERSFVTRSAVNRMTLNRASVGTTGLESARIDELRIGPAKRRDWSVLVSPEQDFGPEVVSLVLGHDFFAAIDVEFDLPNRAVRLFQPRDCAGSSLAYWDGRAAEAQLQGNSEMLVSVAVNGRPILAVLDTGASLSALTMAEAVRFGVNAQSPGVATAGCSAGIGRPALDYWSAPFESFAIGPEVIRNPTLRIADFTRDSIVNQIGGRQAATRFAARPEMILGMDFLRAHRILVANSQRKLYFSYTGGTVFPTGNDKTCRDLR